MTRIARCKVAGNCPTIADEHSIFAEPFARAFLIARNIQAAMRKSRTTRAISELDAWQLKDIGYPDRYCR